MEFKFRNSQKSVFESTFNNILHENKMSGYQIAFHRGETNTTTVILDEIIKRFTGEQIEQLKSIV